MRFCVLLYRDETGKFPDYPSDEEGGSAIVFNPELRAKMLGEGEAWEGGRDDSSSDDDEGGGGANKKKADDKKAKDAAAAAAEKDKKAGGANANAAGAKDEEDESGYRLAKSEFVKGLRAADKQFYGEGFS